MTLAPSTSTAGGFTVYPITNMFNFLLVDQQTGTVWQTQWNTKEEERQVWILHDVAGN